MRLVVRRAALVGAVVIALLFWQSPPARAVCGGPLSPFAFESITVSTVALAFTSATYAPAGQARAGAALVTLEATNGLRYRNDGVADPTAAVGHLVAGGGSFEVCGTVAVTQTKMIRSAAADAVTMITYFR